MERTEQAYAKLNLFLNVTGKRKDGYHELCSVMHAVTLADTVTVNAKRADYSCITVDVGESDIPKDERNLAYLAAEAFLSETGIEAAVTVRIEKKIPVGAGLGGGSADCAATLRALNALFAYPMGEDALLSLGARLGADVPFCLRGGTALCRGIGERMERYSVPEMHFVIALPDGKKVATPEAYRLLDEQYEDFANVDPALGDALFEFFDEDPVDGLFNIFETVIATQIPEVQELSTRFVRLGARGALMTGSGPAVFAVFDSAEEAESVAAGIPCAIVCRSAVSE